ncbi:hypothetical protein M3572_01775 [Lederbergia lenta]|nr:DUF6886 family protein [Lederbergia lenta]MCM3109612.1 hypothetical protein [Lederbergia lenta]
MENQWLERIHNTKLYIYTFLDENFELFSEAKTAGYYISYKEVTPVKVELVSNLLEKVLNEKVELRFTSDLYPIGNSVISSTLDFSIIRFNNVIKKAGV